LSRICAPIRWNDAVASAQTLPGNSPGLVSTPQAALALAAGLGESRIQGRFKPTLPGNSLGLVPTLPGRVDCARVTPSSPTLLPHGRRLRRERARQSYRRVQGCCRRAEYCRAALVTSERTTSTTALSTSATKSLFVKFVSFVVHNPRVRSPRPHIARIDYDYEHRCAEHEHDPVSLSVIFRGNPWPPQHPLPRQKPSRPSSLRGKPPRAIPPRPHIARIDYDYEHRCAEHEHDPVSLSVIIRVIPWPPRGATEPSTAALSTSTTSLSTSTTKSLFVKFVSFVVIWR
jgi:hypothetical protein